MLITTSDHSVKKTLILKKVISVLIREHHMPAEQTSDTSSVTPDDM